MSDGLLFSWSLILQFLSSQYILIKELTTCLESLMGKLQQTGVNDDLPNAMFFMVEITPRCAKHILEVLSSDLHGHNKIYC